MPGTIELTERVSTWLWFQSSRVGRAKPSERRWIGSSSQRREQRQPSVCSVGTMSYMDFFSLVFCKTVDLGQHMIPLVFRKAPPAPLPRRLDLITQRVGGHGIQSTQSRRLTPGRKPPCIRVSLQFHIAPAVSDKPCFGEGTTVKISNACVAPLLILGHSITLAALLVNAIAGLEVRPLDVAVLVR